MVVCVDKMATIKIAPDTRDRLKDRGKKGETYDAIIRRLLEAERP